MSIGKGHRGAGNVLDLDLGGGDTGVYAYKNSVLPAYVMPH